MITKAVGDWAYSFEEVCGFLNLKPATLKRRIYQRTHVPPFQKIAGQFIFPRDLFDDWVRRQPITSQIRGR